MADAIRSRGPAPGALRASLPGERTFLNYGFVNRKKRLIESSGNVTTFEPLVITTGLLTESQFAFDRIAVAREELFNDKLTDFVPTYDGRKSEPVALPCKLPLTLMLRTEGIAVGLAARILSHSFLELNEAQIAILKKKPFKCLLDFLIGEQMDARDYQDGKSSVKVHAKIKAKDESTVVIKEIPPTTTTDSLIASIENATQKEKLKVKSINDFTSENLEIEIKCPSGVDAKKLVEALRLHGLRGGDYQPHRFHQGQPPGRVDGERSVAREHGAIGRNAEA